MFGLYKMVSPFRLATRFFPASASASESSASSWRILVDLIAIRSFQSSALRNQHPLPTTTELDIIVDRSIVWIDFYKMRVMITQNDVQGSV